MEEKYKEICLKELRKQDRPNKVVMVTPYWTETTTRIEVNGKKALIPYEIYSKPTLPSEHNTIKALRTLVEEGKATRTFKGDWIWYTPND